VTTVVAKAVADMEVTATATVTVTVVGLGEVSAVAIAGATKEVSQGAIAGAAEKEVPPVPPLSFHYRSCRGTVGSGRWWRRRS
jgi:hypothetical protein